MAARVLVALVVLGAAGCSWGERRLAPPSTAETDSTAFLQHELDRGGRIFLARLPGGRCYRTRGLWITRSGTELVSDGACLEALGPGPVRLRSLDGDPISSSAVLFVNRAAGGARPAYIRLQGLRIVVPRAADSFGIAISGDHVLVRGVVVEGEPIDALEIGGRSHEPARDVTVLRSRLLGGRRNVLSVVSAVGVRIERSVLSGSSDDYAPPGAASSTGNPSAGIDIEPNGRVDPVVDVRVEHNLIERNAGPGILLALSTDTGLPFRATGFVITGNRILDNGVAKTPPQQGGIAFQGGQSDGGGFAVVTGNVIEGNAGAGLQGHRTEGTALRLTAHDNDLAQNKGGPTSFVHLGRGSRVSPG